MEPVRFHHRLALGLAIAATVLAASAVVIVARREPPKVAVEMPVLGTVPQDREVTAKDVMLLRKPQMTSIDHEGAHVIDAGLGTRLGLAPGETITSLSGRQIHRDDDLREALLHEAFARANVLYVELSRDEVTALVRWRLDNSLNSDREAMKQLMPSTPTPKFAGPIDPEPDDPIAPIVAGITKVSDNHYTITREAKSLLIANAIPILRGIAYSVAFSHARTHSGGIHIYSVEPTSVFAHVGVEDGDTLDDLLVERDEISLVIIRNKNPLMISISVK
jgi:hypothetical protein